MSLRGALMNFYRREAENPATNLKTGCKPNGKSISTARLSIAADGERLGMTGGGTDDRQCDMATNPETGIRAAVGAARAPGCWPASFTNGTRRMIASIWLWVGFSLLILAMLALDLGVFHRKAQPVSSKEALGWTAIWVTLALLFGAGVWHFAGQEKALEFYTGWLIEYSLSVDNVFVFALIFS